MDSLGFFALISTHFFSLLIHYSNNFLTQLLLYEIFNPFGNYFLVMILTFFFHNFCYNIDAEFVTI